MDSYDLDEKYADFEYEDNSRVAHRARPRPKKKKKSTVPTKTTPNWDSMSDFRDDASGFKPTYLARFDPKHHESQWLIDSILPFYQDGLITDVIRRVKGGKEANVYTCIADPATGFDLLAAKLYRPRMLRNLRNNAIYKAGRQLRDEAGKELRGRRIRAALKKKSAFGKEVDITGWIQNEYATQNRLYQAGGDVPKPIAYRATAVLMAYIGDEYAPAPTLNEVNLTPDEVLPLFTRLMDNVKRMLDLNLIHGDLSPYNILYWQGKVTIIDFPQMIDARTNPHAYTLLERDIRRVTDYFHRYGITQNPITAAAELWDDYMRGTHNV